MSKPYTNPVCRGSYALGTACGSCERCVEQRQGVQAKAQAQVHISRALVSVGVDQHVADTEALALLNRFLAPGAGPFDAAGAAATEAQYLAAIAGRSDFRDAYRRALVVVKYARVLRDKWRTAGQKIDRGEFLGAISDTCDATDQFDFGSGKIEDAALAAADGMHLGATGELAGDQGVEK